MESLSTSPDSTFRKSFFHGTIVIYKLTAGTRLFRHVGNNWRLNVHFGLVTPPKAKLTVWGEERSWQRDKVRRTRKLPPAHFYLGSIRSVDSRRTVVGRSSDGRRTVVGRSSGRTSGRRACRQRRRKKNHLIEAAPFGRLDQMWRTTGRLRGRSEGVLPPPSQKPGAAPPSQNFSKKRKKKNSHVTFST